MSWLEKLANKHITHNRDNEGDFGYRVLLHIPIGLLIGIPILGNNIAKLFTKYEENEDKWVKDQAWKDYFGAMIGGTITIILILIFMIIGGILLWDWLH